MNNFIVTVSYFPFVWGKDKQFKVSTSLSKEEVENIVTNKEIDNDPYSEIAVIVETIEEYLADIQTIDIDKI